MKLLATLLLLLIVPATATAREPSINPSTGRIRILYVGDAWGDTPYLRMAMEPSFVGTPVICQIYSEFTDQELARFMRIYMPRTYEDFTGNYDLLILSDASRPFFQLEQLNWFKHGVEDEGMGIMMVGGVEAFGGGYPFPTWADSPVEEALPVMCVTWQNFNKDFTVVTGRQEGDFVNSLPWNTMPFFHGMNVVIPKEGSEVILSASLEDRPLLVVWEFGEGSGLAHAPDLGGAWGESVKEWLYFADYVANMNYLNAGVEIPQNPTLMHNIRDSLAVYTLNRAQAVGVMEFIEKFGARVSVGERRLEEISDDHRKAQAAFIEQEYDECMDLLAGIEEDFTQLSEDLVKLKDRALFWIYVVEWLAVSGTTIACGAVLWTVMVRRRLYREITTTRARHRSEDS